MQEYASKDALIAEIKKTSSLFIKEFEDISEEDRNLRLEEGERTPYENLAYQLGWMALIQEWDREEAEGKAVEMPAPGIKWNQMGPLHERFYADYRDYSMTALADMFKESVDKTCDWIDGFDEDALFKPGGRKWAQATASNWPVWKWVHINTVAPFKSFRTKVRKWKKLRAAC